MLSNGNDADNSVDIADMYQFENNDDKTCTTRDDNQQSKDDADQIEGELKPCKNTKTIGNITPHQGDV